MISASIRFTKFQAPGMAKSFAEVDGGLTKIPAANFSVGTFKTISVKTVDELKAFIEKLRPGDFLTAGIHQCLTSGNCGPRDSDIHRTKEMFPFAAGSPGLLIIDGDRLDRLGLADTEKFAAAIGKLVGAADWVLSPSASSGITYKGETGPTRGIHAFLFIENAAFIPTTLETLHKRAVLLGYAWPLITKDGKILIRSLVDTAMKTSNQPCFEGGAILGAGITQTREVVATPAGDKVSFLNIPPLTPDEEAAYLSAAKKLSDSVAVEAERVRAAWRLEYLPNLVAKGCSHEIATQILDAALSGNRPVLSGDFEIQTDHHGVRTVRELLADKVKYNEVTCRDPLDPDDGPCKAKIYTINSGRPALNSFAHGGATYILQDEPSLTLPHSTQSLRQAGDPPGSVGAALNLVDRTDAGNVAVLADLTAGDLRYVLEWKQWLAWDGNRWKIDNGRQITHQKSLLVAEHYQHLADKSREDVKQPSLSDDEKKRLKANAKSLESWSQQCRNKPKLDAMLGLAQRDPRFVLEAVALDRDEWLFGVENGVIDLQTGQLRPDSREEFVTKRSPVKFNPEATAPRWGRFICEVTSKPYGLLNGKIKPEERPYLAQYLQKALGYCATGSTREQLMFIARGVGSNGKNVLLDMIKCVLGDYGETIAPEVLMAAKFDNGADQASPSTRKLAGARVAFSSESKEGQRLDVAVVKRQTGGGFITARGLHENPFTFKITHKLWLMTNPIPQLDHMDEATKGRLHLIPFDMKWNRPGEVKPDPTLPDAQKDLMEVLMQETEGILLWLVTGAADYCKTRLTPPHEVVAFTQNYLESQDILKRWLEEYEPCAPRDGWTVSELMEEYKSFCVDECESQQISNAAQLGRKLKALGHNSLKCRDGKKYGLRKRQEDGTQIEASREEVEKLVADHVAKWGGSEQCVTV